MLSTHMAESDALVTTQQRYWNVPGLTEIYRSNRVDPERDQKEQLSSSVVDETEVSCLECMRLALLTLVLELFVTLPCCEEK